MIESLKKALNTGVGLALQTWREVEAAGREIARKSRLSEQEAGQFLKSLRETYEKAQKGFESRVNHLVKEVLHKADVATREDLKGLKREIQQLKKQLQAARPASPSRKPAPARPRARKKSEP